MASLTVTRSAQSLVPPAEPTPSGPLALSPIDRVPELRHMVRSLHVFGHGESPAKAIKSGLAKALVEYYPFAGRFVGPSEEGPVRIECTGEGAWFVEAKAGCTLEDVKHLDHPLMIPSDELLPVPPEGIFPLNLPLMMQVTEFTCGGFVVGIISVHTIADGLGAAQFTSAVGELTRGLPEPSVKPVWNRDFIPLPPKFRDGPPIVSPSLDLHYSTIDFSLDLINKVKAQFWETTGQRCSAFDVSAGHAWRSRTRAIKLEADTEVHLCFFANARQLFPKEVAKEGGYYGNCFHPMKVTTTSGWLSEAELVDVVKLIKDTKLGLPADFGRWARGEADPWVMNFAYNSLFVSDWTRLGFAEVDYGWGKPMHIVPFAYFDFMAVAIIGSPPAPHKGARLMTQCVRKEHLAALHDQVLSFN